MIDNALAPDVGQAGRALIAAVRAERPYISN